MYFTIYQDSKKEWRWNLRAGNNEIIAQGEGYKNKKDCLNCIDLVRISADATINEGNKY